MGFESASLLEARVKSLKTAFGEHQCTKGWERVRGFVFAIVQNTTPILLHGNPGVLGCYMGVSRAIGAGSSAGRPLKGLWQGNAMWLSTETVDPKRVLVLSLWLTNYDNHTKGVAHPLTSFHA